MALQGSFKNPYRQNEMVSGAYLRINPYIVDNSDEKRCEFTFSIYYSIEDRDGNNPAQPIFSGSRIITDEYDQYFDEDILKQINTSIKTQLYLYLKNTQFTDWEDC